MTWFPMAFLPPQIALASGAGYSGAVLKAYAAETSTVIPMATGKTGVTTASSFVLNSAGYPTYSGNVIIPHVQENYKLSLYPNQAAADANSGAVWTVDDITIATSTNTAFVQEFSGDNSTTAFTLSSDLGTDEKTLMIFADKAFTEYSTNGTFASDTSWTKGSNVTIAAGVASWSGATTSDLSQTSAVNVMAGESYTIEYDVTVFTAGTVTAKIGGSSGTARSATGTYRETIISAASDQLIKFSGTAFTGSIDNVKVHRTNSTHREILRPEEFTVNGTALTFVTAPATGTNNVLVFAPSLLFGAVGDLVAAAATSEANALTYETLASQWASQTSGIVAATDYSAKAYAIGGTGVTGAAGAAKEWSTKVSATVDGALFSAKEYAQGTQAATGGSAKNWATQTGADVTGAAANSRSAKSWSQDDLHGATLGGSAKDWAQSASLPDGTNKSSKSYATDSSTSATASASSATAAASSATSASSSATTATTQASNASTSATNSATSATTSTTQATNAASSATLASQWADQTSGIVAATDYSAKTWAIGGTGISDGAAKNWAQQTGADVTGAAANSRSAKSWAQEDIHGATLGGSAKDWAQSASLPDGTNKSAKSYASDASTSATSASSSATTATTQASNASTSATNAATSATNAATSATAAAASATTAAGFAAALIDTSTSSLLIAVASKTFTVSASKQFAAGQFISAVSAANNANYMHGQVTSYSGTTLIVNVTDIGGSGTKADWNISVSGSQGATGSAGAAGSVPIAAAAGTVDAITATPTGVTLADMSLCAIVSAGANTLTNPTFAPNSLTAHTITKNGGAALVAGDTGGANYVMLLEYNLANTRWELLNPAKVGGGDIVSSVALAGNPTTTTQSAADSSTKIATTAYADTAAANAAAAANAGLQVDAATTAAANTSAWTYANGASGIGATFTGPVNTAITIDGHAFSSTGKDLLVKNDTQSPSGAFNGIYRLTALQTVGTGAIFTRRADYNQSSDINDTGAIAITNGTTNGGTSYLLTTKVTTVGTDPLTYTIFTPAYANIIQSGGALGTPSSGTLTNCTGLPVGGIAAMAANTVAANATNGSASPTAVALTASTFLGMGSTGNIAACTLGSGLAFSGAVLNLGGTYRTTSAADNLATTDNNGMIDFTGSTNRTFTATAAATLGNGWSCVLRNNSTANITIDPNASETIDTLTTIVMYPGEDRLITCTGSAFISYVLSGGVAVFSASGSWTVPPGYKAFEVEITSSGAAGASRSTTGNASGGSGGATVTSVIAAAQFVAAGSTETVTVGGTATGVTGNTTGTAGNNSALTVNGVTTTVLGGAGGVTAAGSAAAISSMTGRLSGCVSTGYLFPNYYPESATLGFTTVATIGTLLNAAVGGDVTAANVPAAGGGSLNGGGGGGGCSSTSGGTRTGGASLMLGAGGAGGANTGGNATNGTAPAGGGGGAVQGGTSGSGAVGQVTVRGII